MGYRGESLFTLSMLAALTMFTGMSFGRLFANVMLENDPPEVVGEAAVADETPIDASPDDDYDEDSGKSLLPFDIGQRMREWLAKKQLDDGYFFNPPDKTLRKMKRYSAREIMATLPHFTRELLLVTYSAATDEFSVLLPGAPGQPPPICDAGCLRIQNLAKAVVYAFRNRHHARFAPGAPGTPGPADLLLLASTGASPALSRECLERPGGCRRRRDFAPVLHFGSAFRDDSILPSLVLMPPPLGVHMRCMAEWQVRHEVCEFLLPKTVTEDGKETQGITFGEHVNDKRGGELWDDLVPQVVWRGADHPYLELLHPEMRGPDFGTDVEPDEGPTEGKYGRGPRGIVRALADVAELRPRWRAVVMAAEAEFDANAKNANPKRKKKLLPWANMKFSPGAPDHKQWTSLGIPVIGEPMSMEDLAKFKYQVDLGGDGGTSLQEKNNPGTLEKLALPGLLFHHVSGAKDWYHEHLAPWVHYIPVKEDLSDLHEMFDWAQKHDRRARGIAKAGTDFVRRMGRPEGMDELYHRHLLKPLEDIIHSYEPNEEMTAELFRGGNDGFTFQEIMKCSGYDIDECTLLQ